MEVKPRTRALEALEALEALVHLRIRNRLPALEAQTLAAVYLASNKTLNNPRQVSANLQAEVSSAAAQANPLAVLVSQAREAAASANQQHHPSGNQLVLLPTMAQSVPLSKLTKNATHLVRNKFSKALSASSLTRHSRQRS